MATLSPDHMSHHHHELEETAAVEPIVGDAAVPDATFDEMHQRMAEQAAQQTQETGQPHGEAPPAAAEEHVYTHEEIEGLLCKVCDICQLGMQDFRRP